MALKDIVKDIGKDIIFDALKNPAQSSPLLQRLNDRSLAKPGSVTFDTTETQRLSSLLRDAALKIPDRVSPQKGVFGEIKTYQELTSGDPSLHYFNITKEQQQRQIIEHGKKFPNHGDSREGRTDRYNAEGLSEGPAGTYNYENASRSDLIPFYFHDLINEIYIPFRATITGISQGNSAEWDEVQYLGRADKVFIYRGFSEECGFSFRVYANSPKEVLPMWQRVNYLKGMVKPATWTEGPKGQQGDFIVPPFVKFRVGDLFKNQPAIIRSVEVSIPEEAAWEITRVNTNEAYQYLGNVLEQIDAILGQLPTMIEISVNLTILQREKPRVNMNHYTNVKGEVIVRKDSFSAELSPFQQAIGNEKADTPTESEATFVNSDTAEEVEANAEVISEAEKQRRLAIADAFARELRAF